MKADIVGAPCAKRCSRGKITDLRKLERLLAKTVTKCTGTTAPECPVLDILDVQGEKRSERLMSALGQKQTYAMRNGMSALSPIATSIAFFGMSALGQKRTSEPRAVTTPLSNSLLAGKLTGNFNKFACCAGFCTLTREQIQRLAAKFPTQQNREFLQKNREFVRANREFYRLRQKSP